MLTLKYLKRFAIFLVVPFVALAVLSTAPARTGVDPKTEDPAAFYKTKCVACHGPKADKKFDINMSEEEMVDAILKGKKAEKPPHMPEYETKGVTADQAKALVIYMKNLRQAAE